MRQSAHCHFVNGGLLSSGTRLHLHLLLFFDPKNFKNRKARIRNAANEIEKTTIANEDMRTALSPKKIMSPLSCQVIAVSLTAVLPNLNSLNRLEKRLWRLFARGSGWVSIEATGEPPQARFQRAPAQPDST